MAHGKKIKKELENFFKKYPADEPVHIDDEFRSVSGFFKIVYSLENCFIKFLKNVDYSIYILKNTCLFM